MQSMMSAGDLGATYGGTWLMAKWGHMEILVPIYVRDVSNSDEGPIFHVTYGSNGRVSFPLNHPNTLVVWDHPKMGYVNFDGLAVHHQRVMARQWKRGLRQTQLSTNEYGQKMARCVGRSVRFSFDAHTHVEQVFTPTYPSLSEVYGEVVGGGWYAGAFSPKFAIEADPNYKLPLLRYKTFVVGVVDGGEPVLSPDCGHLENQLSKAM